MVLHSFLEKESENKKITWEVGVAQIHSLSTWTISGNNNCLNVYYVKHRREKRKTFSRRNQWFAKIKTKTKMCGHMCFQLLVHVQLCLQTH